MADDVSVRFGADTSGMRTGGAEAKGVLEGLQAAVNALGNAFRSLGGAANTSINNIAAGAQSATLSVKTAAAEMKGLTSSVVGFGSAVIAAFAVRELVEFINKLGEVAEATYHTALTFGLTTSQVQVMKAQAAGLGLSFDAMTTAMVRSDKALTTAREGNKRAAEAFKILGININEPISQLDLLHRTMAGLAGIEDIPTRIGLATQVFGRNIQQIMPMIAADKEELAALNVEIANYGIANDDAEQKGLALAHQTNESKVAFQGLGNLFTQVMGPSLTGLVKGFNDFVASMIRSYNTGGAVKQIADALIYTFDVFVGIVTGAGELIQAAWDLIKDAWDNAKADFGVVSVYIQEQIDEIVTAFRGLGAAIMFALQGNWTAVAAVTMNTIKDVANVSKKHAAEMSAAMAQVHATDHKTLEDQKADWKAYLDFLGTLVPGMLKLPTLPKPSGTNQPPELGGHKAPQESALTALKEQFEEEENAYNDMFRDMTADELAFWTRSDVVAREFMLNDKQRAEVRMRVDRLRHEEAMKGLTAEIDGYRDSSNEIIGQIQRTADARKRDLTENIKDIQDQAKERVISWRQATAEITSLSDAERKQETLDALAIYQSRFALDEFIMQHAAETTSEYIAAQRDEVQAKLQRDKEIEKADAEFNARIRDANRKTADEFKSSWDRVVNPLVSSFTSGISQMMQGTLSFVGFFRNMGIQMLNGFITNVINPMLQKWLWKEIGQTLATSAGVGARTAAETTGAATSVAISGMAALKKITHAAVVAAGNAYSALASIPIIGPELGAIAAAVTFAAVEGFGAMVALAAGGYDVPSGISPLTQLHEQEMVLPRSIANPLRRMVASYDSGQAGSQGTPGMAGDTHQHFWDVDAIDGPSFMSHLRNNRNLFQLLISEIVRGGGAGKMGLATAGG